MNYYNLCKDCFSFVDAMKEIILGKNKLAIDENVLYNITDQLGAKLDEER